MRKTRGIIVVWLAVLIGVIVSGIFVGDMCKKADDNALLGSQPVISNVSVVDKEASARQDEIIVNFINSTYKSVTEKPAGWFTSGQDADIMLSGIDFNNTGGPLLFNHQGNVATDGTHLLLADRNNNRVLIWNSAPTGNSPPDIVLGQENFYANNPWNFYANNSGTGLNQMNWPVSVATDGQHVVVADTYNDRVLIWNNFPTQNGEPADVELRAGIGWPWAVWTNGTKLVVTSTANRTVLIWNSFPTSDLPADIFITSPDFGTPRAIASDGNHLVIGDHNAFVNGTQQQGNFFWKNFPNQTNQQYDFFVAEVSQMGESNPPQTMGGILWGTMTSDGKLIGVSNQLYIWNSFPADENDAPDLSVGAPYYGASGYDFGGSQSGDGSGIAVAGNKLYISLSNGNKIVVFNSLPTASSQNPNFAIGAPDIYTNTLRSNYFITNPGPVSDGKSLFISSDFDRKLYVWKQLPDESGAKPDIMYNLSWGPWANALFGNTLVLAGGNFVYVWNTLPLNGELPDSQFMGSIGNVTFQDLRGVALDNKYFYLADKTANKIYVWEGIPNNNTTNAKFSIDTSMPCRLSSDGTYLVVAATEAVFGERIKLYKIDGLSSSTLPTLLTGINVNLPESALVAGGHLFIADTCFNRVLVWNNISDAVNGIHPEIVLGEEDLNDTHPEIGIDKLFWPARLTFDGSYLWVGEYKFSGRVLRFSPTSLVTVSGDGFEVTYENVTYETIWPIEWWIKREVVVKNTATSNLTLDFNATIVETGVEQSSFPQPCVLYLAPQEKQTIRQPLDQPWAGFNQTDMETEGNHTRTIVISVWLENNLSTVRSIYLNNSIRIIPTSWYKNHPNAGIHGSVYDKSSGEPLKNIFVEFNGVGLSYSTYTNQSGYYEINFYAHKHVMTQQIQPYDLSITPSGYEAFIKPYWPVNGSNIEQDVYLEQTSESVNCTLLKRVETNMTIFRGAVTKDERFVAFSQGHHELNITDEEAKKISSVLFFDTNGTLLWKYTPGYGEVWGVDVSDDGTYVAGAIWDQGGFLLDHYGNLMWNTSKYGTIGTAEIRISHNNKYVAMGSGPGTLYLFNITNGDIIWTQFLEGQIRQLEFSSNDSKIYAGSGDGYLYIVDINGTIISRTDIEAWPYSTGGLILTEDDTYIATASKIGNITLTNATSGQRLWAFDTMGGAHWVDISPNKDYVIAGSGGPLHSPLFDINGTLKWFSLGGGLGSDSGMITNDGRRIIIGRDWGFDIINPNGTVLYRYWEDFSYAQRVFYTHFVYVNKNQTRIIAGHGSGAVYFWNLSITRETEKPKISNIQATPSIQEVNGYVDITCTVTDNVAVDIVKVNITGHLGFTPINITMTRIVGTYNYYHNTTYSVVGTYYFYIWANDTSGNENKSATYMFWIQDSTKPSITDIQANPASQIVGSYVNITCTVTDNLAVNVVKVNIVGPGGFTPVNATMIRITGTDNYYYNISYSIIGTYYYYVWTNDTSNNQNKSTTYTFEIVTGGLTSHTPIYIDGNAGFNATNGVSAGDGSASNPYIIENWDINASSAHGIEIKYIDKYFIIRNCVIHDGKSNDKYGMHFYSVQNGKIDNMTSYNNSYSIYLESSSNNNRITNCTVYNNSYYGIVLDSSSNNQITNCAVYNNDCGIVLLSSSNNQITNCAVYNNDYGICLLYYSSNNAITNCIAYNNSYGISLNSSSNNLVYNNYFNNTANANSSGGSGNRWNITKTAGTNIINGSYLGGNYWSDYTGMDTDGDGLGNTPYTIPGGSDEKDYLPLVKTAPYMIDYIQIRTAPNGGGSVVTTKTYSIGQTDTFYAASYNYTAGYIGEITATWTSSNPSVGSVTSPGSSTTFTALSSGTCVVTVSYEGKSNSTDILTIFVPVNIVTTIVDGKEVKVTYSGDGTVTIKTAVAPPAPPLGNLCDIGIFVYINATGNITEAYITIKYSDTDVTDINEATLRVYYWSGSDWVVIPDSGVWLNNNTVWARVTHLTIFAPFGEKVAMNLPPAINITYPTAGQTVSGTITVAGSSSDTDGVVTKVEIKIDNDYWQLVTGTTTWSFIWNTTVVPNGWHTIYARAYDGLNYSDIKAVNVNVLNPIIIQVSPEPVTGANITAGYTGYGELNVTVVVTPLLAPQELVDIGIYINVTASENITLSWLYIEVPYNESLLPKGVKEENLRLYYWNETSGEWESCSRMGNTSVDTKRNVVWANITHLTIFAPMAEKVAEVQPSPYWLIYAGIVAIIAILAVSLIVIVKRKKKLKE